MYSLFYGPAIIGSVVSAELHVQTHHWANLEAERKKESPFSESVGNALTLDRATVIRTRRSWFRCPPAVFTREKTLLESFLFLFLLTWAPHTHTHKDCIGYLFFLIQCLSRLLVWNILKRKQGEEVSRIHPVKVWSMIQSPSKAKWEQKEKKISQEKT